MERSKGTEENIKLAYLILRRLSVFPPVELPMDEDPTFFAAVFETLQGFCPNLNPYPPAELMAEIEVDG